LNAASTPAAPVALVTGASRGIGRAICQTLARRGWDVCLTYVSNDAAARETVALVEAQGRRALAVKSDSADADQVRSLFVEIDRHFGRIDALVNNAGIVGGQHAILDLDVSLLRAVFDANVIGAFLCTQEAARRMSKQRGGPGGVVVNVSSAAARHGGLPLESHYAASKGAIDSFTIALAKELPAHGIRVNAVRPGLILTDIHEAHGGQEMLARVGPTIPIGHAGQPQEVADVVAFLCSAESSYVHGALIDVSGGR
jgi:NAD(P)-dependent dehydrogenase (short-subunit alcohol dehydrogenase family)